MQKKTLVLITEQFPYGGSETFLETEILYLADAFSSVLLLPKKNIGSKRPLPDNVSVDDGFTTYCNSLNENRKVRFLNGIPLVLGSSGYWRQVRKQPGRYLHPTGFKRVAMWAREAELMSRFFKTYIAEGKLDTQDTLFYTYWLHLATLAFGKILKQAKLVSRAHGFDLYDERGEPPYSNWKCLGLKKLYKLFLISQDGLEYMKCRYPEQILKYEVSRLGVKNPGLTSKPSDDGVFRMVSVAGVRDVKRVHLIVSALRLLADKHPEQAIRWDHFGDGPLMDELQQQVRNEITGKAEVVLHGMVPNTEVMEFYKNNPVDLFINVSSSEGIPVSIMEAQAFGVPVMATDVGGTAEIVNNQNGILLHENPEPAEIAKRLYEMIKKRGELESKRKRSHENWKVNFDADVNYATFVSMISDLY